MGRRSYEEIGHPLPNRETIVVSRTKEYSGENLYTAKSLKEAIDMLRNKDGFIAGGYGLYLEAIPMVEVMYITEVDTAKTIKELRESIGMSRKEFSEHTGIPVRTLEDWEAARRTPPEYIPRLIAYQLKYEELVRERGES